MDGARVYNAKYKLVREGQILYDFTHMWNLRNKTSEQRIKQTQPKKQTPNYREQTGGYQRGGELGDE